MLITSFLFFCLPLITEHFDLLVDLGSWLDYVDATTAAAGSSVTSSSVASTLESFAASNSSTSSGTSPSANWSAQLQAHYRSDAMRQHMTRCAVSLLVLAVEQACTHMASTLLAQLLASGQSYTWVVARSAHDADGLTLLQRAVVSGSSEMVDLVVQWGDEHGVPWVWDSFSAQEQQEHLSGDNVQYSGDNALPRKAKVAAPDDGGALAHRILAEYHQSCSAWGLALSSHDSSGSLDLAAAVEQLPASQDVLTAAAAAAVAAKWPPTGGPLQLLQQQQPKPRQPGASVVDGVMPPAEGRSGQGGTAAGGLITQLGQRVAHFRLSAIFSTPLILLAAHASLFEASFLTTGPALLFLLYHLYVMTCKFRESSGVPDPNRELSHLVWHLLRLVVGTQTMISGRLMNVSVAPFLLLLEGMVSTKCMQVRSSW